MVEVYRHPLEALVVVRWEPAVFDWDDHNINHVARHNLDPEDAEDAVLDPRRVRTDAYNVPFEKRQAIIGMTERGEIIKVVYTKRGDKFRVVTATPATASERKRYSRGR
jgi:uncharacterized protein